LYEQEVAPVIPAVRVGVAGLAALVTLTDDIRRNSLTHPFVENEVLADELILKPPCLGLAGVFDNAPVKLEYV
jgi:hypothetical protein